ncbi:MerC family mercury resistance protein, partial [Acinetobacter baumannii]
GLSFLSEYEGLFITKLLPLFAAIALVANGLGWFSHLQWHRTLLGMVGPAMVLAAMLLFFGQWWTARLLYTGLAIMVGVSIWDLVSPAHRRCAPDS